MSRQIDESITKDFTVHNPLTGAVSDADFLPTCDVFENTTDIPMISPVVVKRVGLTGDYRVSFVASTANGFEIGKSYNVVVTATVVGISAKARIDSFNVEAVSSPAHFTL